MAEGKKSKSQSGTEVKKSKSKKPSESRSDSSKEATKDAGTATISLLADEKAVNPLLSSLFTVKPAPPKSQKPAPSVVKKTGVNGFDPSSALEDDDDSELVEDVDSEEVQEDEVENIRDDQQPQYESARRERKRKKQDFEEFEDSYMQRLVRDGEKEAEKAFQARSAKRKKSEKDAVDSATEIEPASDDTVDHESENAEQSVDEDDDDDDDMSSPPPQHETQQAATQDIEKANRTVFLGNVSSSAIKSKSARKTLIQHLSSFFSKLPKQADSETKHAVESLRFRSTAYTTAIPKKASFARKELMDATTKSTNAYAVYSSPSLAREASRRLNGTVVLDRHLRVDQVAHPAQVDNRRCVFVGNLGFVDDESNIQDANEAEGREVRKRGKVPADVEEGLWRAFSKCGTVESVRVIRDSVTRVGKGIAYVQFQDENDVEAALLYDEKKFPPMLPRKLRVTRAKAQKRNAKPGSGRPTTKAVGRGYQRKLTGAEKSHLGRVGNMLGKAAAAAKPNGSAARSGRIPNANGNATGSGGFTRIEDMVFEGHRATNKSGKSGLKLGGQKRKGKPTTRSAKRGAAFKSGGSKKKRAQ